MNAVPMSEFVGPDIQEFLRDACTVGPGHIPAGDLYGGYVRWAKANGKFTASRAAFGRIAGRDFRRVSFQGKLVYVGLTRREVATA